MLHNYGCNYQFDKNSRHIPYTLLLEPTQYVPIHMGRVPTRAAVAKSQESVNNSYCSY